MRMNTDLRKTRAEAKTVKLSCAFGFHFYRNARNRENEITAIVD